MSNSKLSRTIPFFALAISFFLWACDSSSTSSTNSSSSSGLTDTSLSSGTNSSNSSLSSNGTSSQLNGSSSSSAIGTFDTTINPFAGLYHTSFEPGGDCSDDYEFEDITIETNKYTAVHTLDGCEEYTYTADLAYSSLGGSEFALTNGSVVYNDCSGQTDRTVADSTLELFASQGSNTTGYRFMDDDGVLITVCAQ